MSLREWLARVFCCWAPLVRCCRCWRACTCCWCCECCQCCECCCGKATEKDPLLKGLELETGIDKETLVEKAPKVQGREMQELEYHFTPASSEPSTPWESEVGSEASERPEQAMKDLQVELYVEGEVPSTERVPVSDQLAGGGPSWKLLPTQSSNTTQQVVFVQSTVEKNEKDKDQ